MTFILVHWGGSAARSATRRRLADAVAKLATPALVFSQLGIADLPLYNQDDDDHQAAPVLRLKAAIATSQGVLFVTPEYNRPMPGVLKNAIDHASRPYGRSAWSGKPAGVLGVSVGVIGTALAQQHLRNVLASLDMPTLAQPAVLVVTSRCSCRPRKACSTPKASSASPATHCFRTG